MCLMRKTVPYTFKNYAYSDFLNSIIPYHLLDANNFGGLKFMQQVFVMNEYQTQIKRKNVITIAAVVLGHIGSLWAVSLFKVPEISDLKKDPIVVRFVNLQSETKTEQPKVETQQNQPKPKPEIKPEPEFKPKPIEKVQSVEKVNIPKQVEVSKPNPVVEQPKKIAPIVDAPPVVQTAVQPVQQKPTVAATTPNPVQVMTSSTVKDVEIGANGVQWKREPRISVEESELRGGAGIVLVMIEANEEGEITSVKVLESSGISSLDAKVVRAVRRAQLKPYMENGLAYSIKAKQLFQFN